MLTHLKNSVSAIPHGLTPREAAMISEGTILRNVSLLGKTQTVILNAAPVIPEQTYGWLNKLMYSPGHTTKIPDHVDEFHAYYWLTQFGCVDEKGRFNNTGAPVNILGTLSVTISKGFIKNVIITE